MKICIITGHYPPHIGGVEIAFEEYAKRLTNQGHDVRVITSNSGGIIGEKTIHNTKIYYLNCKSFFGHPILRTNQIKKHVQWADIVHTTLYTVALPALKTCKKYGKPCVLMVPEVLGKKWFIIEKNPVKALGFLLFERFVLKKNYNFWQPISKATENDLLNYGIEKEKTRLVYLGIDNTIWNHNVKKKSLSSLLGFKDSDKIFLYNGRPGKTKGIFLLLEAIKMIRKNLPPEFKFGFIISKNPKKSREQFEYLIKKYELQDIVNVAEALPYEDLPGYRMDSYAFIVPSLTEGFGFSAAETSALGIPLIVSTAGSLPEVASGKVLFFENGNTEDLAKKIKLATQNKFSNVAEKKFNWDESVKEINKIYKELT